jgi:simple sugar transport system ATP-binding protein
VHHLSVGERQRVEILRCLIREPNLIILDEPTSVLTPQEAEALFETLRRLAGEGRAILFISHKLDEVRALCHAATVLRAGKVVASCDPRRESAASLARLMVGADVSVAGHGEARAPGAARLTLDRLSLPADNPHGVALAEIELTVHEGEIVGIAGVAGNGQSEFLAAVSGERPAQRAEAIRIGAEKAGRLDIAARRRLGLAVIPEERLGQGAVAELSLADNALLTAPPAAALVRRGLIRRERLRDFATRIVGRFGVVAAGIDAEARSLSGGNMQKFIIGREILNPPKLLVAAHPTWGVDIGAAAAIHRALLDLRAKGCAILLVSEDLDELLAITDRIAVITGGRLSPAMPTAAADRGHLGELMTGMKGAAHAA